MRISSTARPLVDSTTHTRAFLAAAALCAALPLFAQTPGTVLEFPVVYPNITSVETGACHPAPKGSTHEITFNPDGGSDLWITGQNYDQVVRVTQSGAMTFYPMPRGVRRRRTRCRAGRCPCANPSPAGNDYVIRIDKSILTTAPADISKVPITYYKVPTTQTVMHRIVQGPDGNIWFTELGVNKVGKLVTH